MEFSIFATIAALCNFGGGQIVETVKCQKYYVNCLRVQVAEKKTKGYEPGMIEACVVGLELNPITKKPKPDVGA